MQVRKQYPFSEFEPKWQDYWLKNKTFKAANPGEPGSEKPKYYGLDMLPYPSGAGLHVGHPEGYTATDIICRFKRMKGFNVLHPMGWDSFGLPAEQHAIATGTHPRATTEENINTFRRQIRALGFSYDWDREFSTTDTDYYKWTQWIFLQLYHKGLAYVADAPVWYCPDLGTVLSNEEVLQTTEGPRSERGDYPVERRPLRQWMFKITAYAERLLKDLDLVDWPESLKEMQRNWIGRSEGAEIDFAMEGATDKITVFTTRHDTLFGATYLVLAPEHPLVEKLTSAAQKSKIDDYRKSILAKSELERTDLAKTKTGVFTGGNVLHPVTGEKVPVWIADYVLLSYGTGAVMGVPAHDERDHEFATKYKLSIVEVMEKPPGAADPFCGESKAVNSDFLNNLPTAAAKKKMAGWLEEKSKGRVKVQYKLRDWLFSRQRYWGEPFPVIWKKDGKHYPVDINDLPVLLPDLDDYKPSAEGLAPLSKAKSWVELPDGAKRETNTMPNWAGSCWYFLRYCDPKNTEKFIDPEIEKYWFQPRGIDLYIGGAEHAVLHLLYARFWHKVLFDLGHVSTPEPFYKLVNQGMILGEDNRKMSKSFGNVVNPDDVVKEYGADSLRMFEMYMGPLTAVKPWSTTGVNGVYRFLGRVWRLVMEEDQAGNWVMSPKLTNDAASPEILRQLHATIKKVGDDIEALQFNTAIAQMMILVNDLTKEEKHPRAAIETLVLLLAPFAPHVAEELWSKLGHPKTLSQEPWPKFDEKYLEMKTAEYVVQVNGKVRAHLTVPVELTQAEVETKTKALPEMKSWLDGKNVAKVIFVPKKLINFVVT